MSIDDNKKKRMQLKYRQEMQKIENEKNYIKEIFIVAIIFFLIILSLTFFDSNPLQDNNLIKIEKVQ